MNQSLNNLSRTIKKKARKRLGRGPASGKGKTAAKGEKGQKKRGKVKLFFEGGQLPLKKRLPEQPGVGNKSRAAVLTVTTQQLNALEEKSVVDQTSLAKAGLIPKSAKTLKIKVVATGKIERALKVKLPASKKAGEMIKKAGGELTYENPA